MATGDSPEMRKMQEEALRRARETHRKSNPQKQESSSSLAKTDTLEQPPSTASTAGLDSGVMEVFMKDRERTLILAILILLSSENGSNDLLFALLYLLM